jgi:hypothetical protein
MWISLWILNPAHSSADRVVGDLFGPRPRPLTMGVRERGRGPNRKRVVVDGNCNGVRVWVMSQKWCQGS